MGTQKYKYRKEEVAMLVAVAIGKQNSELKSAMRHLKNLIWQHPKFRKIDGKIKRVYEQDEIFLEMMETLKNMIIHKKEMEDTVKDYTSRREENGSVCINYIPYEN